jgi:hypothetical protein
VLGVFYLHTKDLCRPLKRACEEMMGRVPNAYAVGLEVVSASAFGVGLVFRFGYMACCAMSCGRARFRLVGLEFSAVSGLSHPTLTPQEPVVEGGVSG